MLLIETSIGPSKIHGIGLFATQDVRKGKMIWKYEPKLDISYSHEEFNAFPKHIQDFLYHFSYYEERTDKYVLCGDNARFFNRSEAANCVGDEGNNTVAARDISAGEELTEIYFNYKEWLELQAFRK